MLSRILSGAFAAVLGLGFCASAQAGTVHGGVHVGHGGVHVGGAVHGSHGGHVGGGVSVGHGGVHVGGGVHTTPHHPQHNYQHHNYQHHNYQHHNYQHHNYGYANHHGYSQGYYPNYPYGRGYYPSYPYGGYYRSVPSHWCYRPYWRPTVYFVAVWSPVYQVWYWIDPVTGTYFYWYTYPY